MRQFWARRGKHIVGPCADRDAVIAAFRKAHPFKGEDYEARATRNQIVTGYGTLGPVFDIRWHVAREKGQDNE